MKTIQISKYKLWRVRKWAEELILENKSDEGFPSETYNEGYGQGILDTVLWVLGEISNAPDE